MRLQKRRECDETIRTPYDDDDRAGNLHSIIYERVFDANGLTYAEWPHGAKRMTTRCV